jgi:hypothetical protein
MKTFFCVMSWPNGGTAEMMVEAFEKREDAEIFRDARAAKYPAWRFCVAEYQEV